MKEAVVSFQIPTNCVSCDPCSRRIICPWNTEMVDCKKVGYNPKYERHPNCPIIVLPDKHGRLIDENELIRAKGNTLEEKLRSVNTLVPAKEKSKRKEK